MERVRAAIAKLAGVRKAVQAILEGTDGSGPRSSTRPIGYFLVESTEHHFTSTMKALTVLREELPDYYGDFAEFPVTPQLALGGVIDANGKQVFAYGRDQVKRLAQDIDQIFEIRANSELAVPKASKSKRRVFISHGRAADWREVQTYIEKDISLDTLELAQEANQGRTILGKLWDESEKCNCAVIVMTGDDLDSDGQARARENVIHEIGFFQGRYGLDRIVLLHEDGVNIPSNIHGVVYTPFPKGLVSASFGVLVRELNAMFR